MNVPRAEEQAPSKAPTDRGARGVYAIESIRAVAVLMLVSYHAIGAGPHDGLHLAYPHPLRFAADLLADARMPLFAMISGIVYALRPVEPANIARFITGKFRRLALPGAVAITVFAVFSGFFAARFSPNDIVAMYFWPYAHYWYLQATLVIFVVYCTFDIVTSGRFLLPSFAVALALHMAHLDLTRFFSISSSLYILPYFILGMILSREHRRVKAAFPYILALAVIFLVIGFSLNIQAYEQAGALSANRRDLQSVLAGFGICTFAVLVVPPVKALEWIGPPSFVIYLYHVLGTSGMRRLLGQLHVQSVTIHLILGTLAGILFGYSLYRIARLHPLTRLIICGERTHKPAAGAIAQPPVAVQPVIEK